MAYGLGHTVQNDLLKPDGFRSSTSSLLLGTLAISVLSLSFPVMTLQVYDRILPNPGTGTLPVLITGVCLAVVLEACLRLCRAYMIGRAGAAYEHRMACEAVRKILNADLTQIGPHGIGEHLHRMGAIGKLKDFYNGYALSVVAELVFVPLYLGLIIYIGRFLAVVPATVLVLFIMVSLWRGYCLRRALLAREQADDRRFNFLIEALEGVHTLKAFALEKFFERRYEALEEDSTFGNYNVTQETSATFNAGAVFSHLMVASVISAGAWLVLNGMLTTGGLIATLLLSGRMMQPIQKALALWARYQDYALARRNVETLFATPQKKTVVRAEEYCLVPDGRLSLRGVSFRYHAEDELVLDGIDLQLKRGDVVLISGAHGAGKTTLLNLIAGIYAPAGGSIEIDGADIATFKAGELVHHVGYVRSRPPMFRGTIRDNITCFGQTDLAQAREVAALLGVDKDVAKLPGGFDTFLHGNNTDSIPPGLKQRIAIVRVLATKPRLILFDNADHALDKEGYAKIYSLLARLKGKASMILVSDDRNIRALADRHYELTDGVLVPAIDPASRGNVRPYRELRI